MKISRDYYVLNEDVRLLLNSAILDMLESLCQLESRTDQWYATTDIISVFFSIPLAAEATVFFNVKGSQYTWNELPQAGSTVIPFVMV